MTRDEVLLILKKEAIELLRRAKTETASAELEEKIDKFLIKFDTYWVDDA